MDLRIYSPRRHPCYCRPRNPLRAETCDNAVGVQERAAHMSRWDCTPPDYAREFAVATPEDAPVPSPSVTLDREEATLAEIERTLMERPLTRPEPEPATVAPGPRPG